MDTDSRIAMLALRLRDTRLLLLLLLSIAVCIALFIWRNAAIGLDEPLLDGRMAGYMAPDAFDVLGTLSSGDRTLYAITALTLDTIFPVLYVALMLGVIARVVTDARGLLALPLVVGIADLAENAAVATLALSYPGDAPVAATGFSPGLSIVATAAGGLTLVKWWTLGLVAIVIVWGTFRKLTRTSAPDDGKWVPKIAQVLEKELE